MLKKYQSAVISTAIAVSLVATPLSSALARGRNHGFPLFGVAAAGTALVVGAITLLTAPIALATAPLNAATYYPPPQAPYYPSPSAGYYAPPPPQAYYAPPPQAPYYTSPSAAYNAPPPAYPYAPGYLPGYYGPR
jgi:hypothetical protein